MDEMFVEFFDAIDDLSDNEQLEGTSGNHGIIQEVHTGNQYGKRHAQQRQLVHVTFSTKLRVFLGFPKPFGKRLHLQGIHLVDSC